MTPEQGLLATSLLANILGGLKLWFDSKSSAEERTTRAMAKGWEEVQMRDTIIENLRQALLRSSKRENAYSTGCELLLIAMPKHLTQEQREIVTRARSLFDAAWLHTGSGAS